MVRSRDQPNFGTLSNMNELWDLALESIRSDHRTVLVLVVDHQGSVPGTAGAALVVSSLGCAGTVGGGTAEHTMIERARDFDGSPELVDIEHTPEAHGTLCSGRQTIALIRLAASDQPTVAAICDTLRAGRVGTLRVTRAGISFEAGATAPQRLTTDATGFRFATTLGRLDTLTIVGGGHCALALSRVMATLPFRVVVLDDRPDLPTLAANSFADEIRTVDYADLAAQVPEGDRSWVVVMTFGHAHDETALRALVGHRVRYLGLLGSSAKVAAMFAAMRRRRRPRGLPVLDLRPGRRTDRKPLTRGDRGLDRRRDHPRPQRAVLKFGRCTLPLFDTGCLRAYDSVMPSQTTRRLLAAAAVVLCAVATRDVAAQLPQSSTIASEWTTGITSDQAGYVGFAVGDVDADGVDEIASCSWGSIFVLGLIDGEYLPVWYSHRIGCSAVALGDVDGDLSPEIYAGTDAEAPAGVRVWRASTVDSSWLLESSDPLPFGGAGVNGLAMAELDGDPGPELVVVSDADLLVLDGSSFAVEWLGIGLGGAGVAAGDVDGDSQIEIVVNSDPGRVLDAGTQSVEWSFLGGFGYAMAVGDVAGDAAAEVAYVEDWDVLAVVDGSTHSVLWQLPGLDDLESIAVADLDGTGKAEIVVGDGQWGDVTGYDGGGAMLWQIANPEHTVNAVSTGDVNGDGTIEIVWGAEQSNIGGYHLVADWESETILWASENLD